MGDVIEAFMISDIVYYDNSMCAPVVAVCDCPETLLSCGVPLKC